MFFGTIYTMIFVISFRTNVLQRNGELSDYGKIAGGVREGSTSGHWCSLFISTT